MLVVTFAVALALLCFALVCLALAERNLRKAHENLERFRAGGTHRVGGYRKPYAFTTAKGHGVRILETVTLEGCSSSSAPGALSVVSLDPTLPARVNSYIAPGSSIFVTGILGVSGVPRERAV